MGKWRYMSPEQARGDTLDTRSDLFSAASVLFELFTGDKLFPGDEAEDIIKNIETMPIPRMSALRPGLPSRLDEVLALALARKPIDRPSRPASILRSLIELSYESSIMATALDVAEALAARGLEIDRRSIDLADPIKTVGDFEVPVKLHSEVVGKARVKVEAEAG
jgi:serine/threonine protein kinase